MYYVKYQNLGSVDKHTKSVHIHSMCVTLLEDILCLDKDSFKKIQVREANNNTKSCSI